MPQPNPTRRIYLYFVCVDILLVCVLVHHFCTVSMASEEGVGSPVAGVTGSCEPLCGCRQLNPGSFEGQSVLLTTEPFPQPHSFHVF